MPMEALSTGMPITLVQNQIYALPPRLCRLFTSATAPTIQVSNNPTFSPDTPVAVTLTAGAADVAAGWIRCTSAGPTIVTLKGY